MASIRKWVEVHIYLKHVYIFVIIAALGSTWVLWDLRSFVPDFILSALEFVVIWGAAYAFYRLATLPKPMEKEREMQALGNTISKAIVDALDERDKKKASKS